MLKWIKLLNLQTKKTSLPKILNADKVKDFTGAADIQALPTMARPQERKERLKKFETYGWTLVRFGRSRQTRTSGSR